MGPLSPSCSLFIAHITAFLGVSFEYYGHRLRRRICCLTHELKHSGTMSATAELLIYILALELFKHFQKFQTSYCPNISAFSSSPPQLNLKTKCINYFTHILINLRAMYWDNTVYRFGNKPFYFSNRFNYNTSVHA